MSKIGLIGSVCIDRESSSGQAIRTTILYKALLKRYGKEKIVLVNTAYKKKPLRLVLDSVVCLLSCKDIIIMVSRNGCKRYYPILSFAARFFGKKIYNNVIGGNFPDHLRTNAKMMKYVSSFTVNWIQMQGQVDELKEMGLTNVELLNNTKENKPLSLEQIDKYSDKIFRFCMFSRISKEKGTERAIKAIQKINNDAGEIIVTLDIYGLPDNDYKDEFEKLLSRSSNAIHYCGFVNSDDAVNTLKGYFMLLFPTVFYGEGFPGTLWDTFSAGVPAIATDWHYNAEVLTDNKTGLIYDHTKETLLEEKILYAINHTELIDEMRINCINELNKYTPDKVFPVVFKYFD